MNACAEIKVQNIAPLVLKIQLRSGEIMDNNYLYVQTSFAKPLFDLTRPTGTLSKEKGNTESVLTDFALTF